MLDENSSFNERSSQEPILFNRESGILSKDANVQGHMTGIQWVPVNDQPLSVISELIEEVESKLAPHLSQIHTTYNYIDLFKDAVSEIVNDRQGVGYMPVTFLAVDSPITDLFDNLIERTFPSGMIDDRTVLEALSKSLGIKSGLSQVVYIHHTLMKEI